MDHAEPNIRRNMWSYCKDTLSKKIWDHIPAEHDPHDPVEYLRLSELATVQTTLVAPSLIMLSIDARVNLTSDGCITMGLHLLTKLVHVDLSGNYGISEFPLGGCVSLETCNLAGVSIVYRKEDFANMPRLWYLNISNNGCIQPLPEGLAKCVSLAVLFANASWYTDIVSIGCLRRLKYLNLRGNHMLEGVPDLSKCYALRRVNLSETPITDVKFGPGEYTALDTLQLFKCNLQSAPSVRAPNLKSLTLRMQSHNVLSFIEPSMGASMRALTQLNIDGNSCAALPAPMMALTVLRAARNLLTALDLSGYPALTQLDVSNNLLTDIPSTRARHGLQSLACSRNCITRITQSTLDRYSSLVELHLDGNPFQPGTHVDTRRLKSLKRLNLEGTPVADIMVDTASIQQINANYTRLTMAVVTNFVLRLVGSKIQVLKMLGIELSPAFGALKTLTELEIGFEWGVTDAGDIRDHGDHGDSADHGDPADMIISTLPVTLGNLYTVSNMTASALASTLSVSYWLEPLLLELHVAWQASYFPRYPDRDAAVVACFGKKCMDAIFTTLLCLGRCADAGHALYCEMLKLVCTYWQPADWA